MDPFFRFVPDEDSRFVSVVHRLVGQVDRDSFGATFKQRGYDV